jgi:hypothetical protein
VLDCTLVGGSLPTGRQASANTSSGSRGIKLTARLKLKPGQKGTKRLLAVYGDALVCVRYRYDEASRTRIKTIELVVEKILWEPPARKFTDSDIVPVRIGFSEKNLITQAKAVKGRWDPEVKLWFIRYGKIRETALEKHIVLDAFPGK